MYLDICPICDAHTLAALLLLRILEKHTQRELRKGSLRVRAENLCVQGAINGEQRLN